MADRTARRLIAAATLAPAVLLATLTPVAHAAENAPPEPRDDTVTIYAGGTRHVTVLANDTDPDGDEVAVCRIGEASPGLRARKPEPAPPGAPPELAEAGDLVVTAGRTTAGRELSVVYYACDDERLVPATVTVEVLEATPMRVRARPGRPRAFVAVNTQDFAVDFSYGFGSARSYFSSFSTLPAGKRLRFWIPAEAKRASWGATSIRRGYADRGPLRLR